MINQIKKILAVYSTLPQKIDLLAGLINKVNDNSENLRVRFADFKTITAKRRKELEERVQAVEELLQGHLGYHDAVDSDAVPTEYSHLVEKQGPAAFVIKKHEVPDADSD